MSTSAAYTGALRVSAALTCADPVHPRPGHHDPVLMLWDQIPRLARLGPFTDLPLVGPPTHFRGFTIGPAFYWILWAFGPRGRGSTTCRMPAGLARRFFSRPPTHSCWQRCGSGRGRS
jgi:hypothetical protein